MNFNFRTIKYKAILIAAIILIPFLFFTGGPEHHAPRSLKHFWNLGHIIYFAILPLGLIACAGREKLKDWHQILAAISLAVIVGTIMELFQSAFDRTFDPYDLLRNLIGAMLGISFIYPVRRIVPKTVKVLTLLMVATQLYPISISLLDEYHLRRDFPIISNFETPFQIERWDGCATFSVVQTPEVTDNHSLKVAFPATEYPGVNMKYFPPDWHLYRWFQFRVYNPTDSAVSISCRIHDERHLQGVQRYEDRFSRNYQINSGWNTITINLMEVSHAPNNRLMNLTKIRGIGIFTIRPPHPLTLYIDDLILN